MLAVYTKENCRQCDATTRWLKTNNVEYLERKIMDDPEYLVALKGMGFMQAPVVVPADASIEPWAGYRPDLLAQVL